MHEMGWWDVCPCVHNNKLDIMDSMMMDKNKCNVISPLNWVYLKYGYIHQNCVSLCPRSEFGANMWFFQLCARWKWRQSWIPRCWTKIYASLYHHCSASTLKRGYSNPNRVSISHTIGVMAKCVICAIHAHDGSGRHAYRNQNSSRSWVIAN
jgi:hypothetical protein